MKQPHRAHIRVQIETESQRKKNLGGMLLIGHARIAYSAKQNCAEIFAEHIERAGRQRYTFSQVFLGTPIELDELQSCAEYFIDPAQHAHRLTGNINSDPIPRYNRYPFHPKLSYLTSALYSVKSACKCDSSSLANSIKIFRPFASGISLAKSRKN